MSIEAIGAIDLIGQALPSRNLGSEWTTVGNPGGFESWVAQEITEVDSHIKAADQSVRNLALGNDESLHGAMLSLEKAKLSFEFLVQVRNRVLEGYQEVMRMQI